MIKVGIYGPDEPESPVRKQLLRLLLRHPDVDLRSVASGKGNSRKISLLHPLYTGETELALDRNLNLDKLDVVFVIDEKNLSPEIINKYHDDSDFKIILLGECPNHIENPDFFENGLPEYNRKALVRGARAALNPTPEAMAVELALFPLAKFGLLNGTVNAVISTSNSFDTLKTTSELNRFLAKVQPSFTGEVELSSASEPAFERIDVECVLKCTISAEEIEKIFDDTYSDHNFTYRIPGSGTIDEDLRGSNKCLIRLSNEGENLRINVSIDALTRGVTGNAVHIMNLFFGLYERTGLTI